MADPGPQVHAIIAADEIRQEANGKWLVIGYYADVRLDRPPPAKSLFVHASVSNIVPGEHEIGIIITNLSAKKAMSLPADKFNCPSLDHVLLLVSEVEEFKFPNPGDYKIQITIDGEKCGETVFSLNFPTGEDSTAKAEADSSQPS